MRSIAGVQVALPRNAEDALSSLAICEYRDARAQATVLILEGLQCRGLIEIGEVVGHYPLERERKEVRRGSRRR